MEVVEAAQQRLRDDAADWSQQLLRANRSEMQLELDADRANHALDAALAAAAKAREAFDKEREEAATAALQRSERAAMAAVGREQADELVDAAASGGERRGDSRC